MSSILFLSRNNWEMLLGTFAGIFLRMLWARLSWTRFLRSLKIFLARLLSLILLWCKSSRTRCSILLKAPGAIFEIWLRPSRSCSKPAGRLFGISFKKFLCIYRYSRFGSFSNTCFSIDRMRLFPRFIHLRSVALLKESAVTESI